MHTYFYQKYDKLTEINQSNEGVILFLFIKLTLLNDLCYVIAKNISLYKIRTLRIQSLIILLPIVQYVVATILFGSIAIQGYYKTFTIIKHIWLLMNCIKTLCISFRTKFISDLIRVTDNVWLVNIVLIMITDPIVNTTERPNAVTFYEVYFRFVEFQILWMAMFFVVNEKNVETEVNNKMYTTSAIIGKYDSFRFTVILVIAHYYFVLINGLAYSIR